MDQNNMGCLLKEGQKVKEISWNNGDRYEEEFKNGVKDGWESLFGEMEKSIMKENGKMGNVMEKGNI